MGTRSWLLVRGVVLCLIFTGLVRQSNGNEWTSLAVYPAEIKLHTAADYQNVIAVAKRADAITVDVTSQAQWAVEYVAHVKLDNTQLVPVGDCTPPV